MPTLPTLTVLLDDGTGTFPKDITSKVMGIDGYEISRGRADWIGAVTAGELSLTLNNSDGRFSPGSTILGSPSPIKVDQRIRLKETVNGVTYTRYTGYVKSWPVSWPEVVTTFSTVQITATDAQARAARRPLRSMLEEEILLDSPTAYYTLGEATGSTVAGDTSGSQAPPLTIVGTGAALAFGTGIGPSDGLPAVTFAGGQYLTAAETTLGTGTWSAAVFFSTSTIPPGIKEATILAATSPSGGVQTLRIDVGGLGTLQVLGGGGTIAAAVVADAGIHCALVTMDGSNLRLYLDGPLVANVGGAGGAAFPTSDLSIGRLPAPFFDSSVFVPFTGVVSHVALFDGVVLSAARAAAYALALSGFSETADARIARIAGYVGIPTGTLDASLTTVPTQATSGSSAQDAIQEVVDAEMGLVFIDASGNLTFHNRGRVTSKTAPDLTLNSQYVTPDVQPVTDDQQIVNYVESTAAGTGGVSVVLDATSETSHGRYPGGSQTYLVQTDDEALSRGQWIVAKQAEPTARYGTLTINLYKMSAAQASATLAALDLNCRLQVTSMASQTPGGTTVDVVIQGWRESTTAESWTLTANVLPFSLFQAAIWDDPASLWDTAVWAV